MRERKGKFGCGMEEEKIDKLIILAVHDEIRKFSLTFAFAKVFLSLKKLNFKPFHCII